MSVERDNADHLCGDYPPATQVQHNQTSRIKLIASKACPKHLVRWNSARRLIPSGSDALPSLFTGDEAMVGQLYKRNQVTEGGIPVKNVDFEHQRKLCPGPVRVTQRNLWAPRTKFTLSKIVPCATAFPCRGEALRTPVRCQGCFNTTDLNLRHFQQHHRCEPKRCPTVCFKRLRTGRYSVSSNIPWKSQL